MADDPALDIARFGGAAYDRLWSAARSRIERSGRTFGSTPIRLNDLDDAEIAALCGLLGRRRPSGRSINVDLQKLDAVLQASAPHYGVIEVLETLGGPVRDRTAERHDAAVDEAILWASALAHPAAADQRVCDWIESLRRRGRVTRLQSDDPVSALSRALDAVSVLLTEPRKRSPLPVLAAEVSGDAHRLDPTSHTGTLAHDAVRFISGQTDDRAAWAYFGVDFDLVNTSALVLNVPGLDGSLLGAAAGQPLRITGRMLRDGLPLAEIAGRRVRVCENPAVVAVAADELGPACAPLVCTEGMPATVTSLLLSTLRTAGADLRVHADFDVGGIAIAQHVISRFDAIPWRFGAAAYTVALAMPSSKLVGTIGSTDWDPPLADVMNSHRRAIHEEAVLDTLLDDLAR